MVITGRSLGWMVDDRVRLTGPLWGVWYTRNRIIDKVDFIMGTSERSDSRRVRRGKVMSPDLMEHDLVEMYDARWDQLKHVSFSVTSSR